MYKSSLDQATMNDNQDNIVRYFGPEEFKELLAFDPNATGGKTLETLNEYNDVNQADGEDAGALPSTPTNDVHKEWLEDLDVVTGIVNREFTHDDV